MAGIDYNILGQIKPFQLESPMNAMAQAMQLRGLQESSQMNALKAQEYQQQVQEKNALARLMGSGIPYGSDEFFNRLSVEAPSYVEPIASGVEKRRKSESERETALLTRQQREQATEEAARKTKEARRVTALRGIASATTPDSAYAMMQHYYGQGDLGYDDYQLLAPELLENPNWRATQTNILTRLLPAKEALTAGADIEKATLGVDTEKQKLEKEKLALETAQLDTRLNQFNAAFPAFNIRSEQDVEKRIRAMADDKVLGPLATRFGPLEDTIARNIAEYRRNPLDYVKRMSGVSAENILKAAEEKENKEYSNYRLNELVNRRQPLTQEEYFKRKRGEATAAPAAESPAAVAPAQATAVAPEEKGPSVGTAVSIEAKPYGVDLIDPEAQTLLLAAASAETSAEKDVLIKLAEKIQTEHAARRRNQEFTGTYQNVDIALRDLERLRKEPKTPENEKRIEVLEGLIAAAQVPQRPPAPTEISKKENELDELQAKLNKETDPTKKKTLKDRIARLKADISGDVYGRDKPPATTPVQDALISKAILEGRLDPGKVNSRNIAVIARTLEMDPNANLKELSIDAMSATAASKTLSVQQAKILTAANEADNMIKIVRNTSTKLDLTQYPTINAIQNAVDKGTGGKEIVALNTAINALINAYARAINPNGVATVRDKNHAEALINSNLASGQLNAALDVMTQEMRAAIASPAETSKQLREQRNQPVKNAPAPYTDAEKERRYQAWKAKQGGK